MFLVWGLSSQAMASSLGVDLISNTGSGWTVTQVPVSTGTEYQAICRDTSYADRYYVALASGGIETHYQSGGSWVSETASPTSDIYNDIGNWRDYNLRYFAANAGGGIDVIGQRSSGWELFETIPGTAGTVYTALARDNVITPTTIREFFAAKADGGVDQILVSGSSWNVNNLSHTAGIKYASLTGDINEQRKYYGAKVGGGIDVIGETSHSELPGTSGLQYVDLAADKAVDNRLYGVKPDGSMDVIYLDGATWVTEPISISGAYVAVDTFDTTSSLVAIQVPEPTTLILLGLVGLIRRRR